MPTPRSHLRATRRATAGAQAPKRRRRRRGGRGGKRPGAGLQASFDHGEADGYGLWLDPGGHQGPDLLRALDRAPQGRGHDRAGPNRDRAVGLADD